MEQEVQYKMLSECVNALEGIAMDLTYAYDRYMDAMEYSPDADYDQLLRIHQTVLEIKDRMESRADEVRPTRMIRITEKVTFYKDIEVPADMTDAETDAYLADHE